MGCIQLGLKANVGRIGHMDCIGQMGVWDR